eukprot:m.239515 g.239515  ORF g.239515 m.239515 type:complete len:3540 (-) comp26579_c0_seq4:145-10764(-)
MPEIRHKFTSSSSWGWDNDICDIATLNDIDNGFVKGGLFEVDVIFHGIYGTSYDLKSRTIVDIPAATVRTLVANPNFKDGECYTSDTFTLDGVPLCLQVYPRGGGKGKGKHLSVFLKPVDSIDWKDDIKSVHAKWTVILKSHQDGKEIKMRELDYTFTSSTGFGWDDDLPTIEQLNDIKNEYIRGGIFEVQAVFSAVARSLHARVSRTIVDGYSVRTLVAIDNFKSGEYYTSDTFLLDGAPLCLHVHPHGKGKGAGKYLSVFLSPKDPIDWTGDIKSINCKYTIALKSSVTGKKITMKEIDHTFTSTSTWGWDDDIVTISKLRDPANGYVVNGIFDVEVTFRGVALVRHPRFSRTIVDGYSVRTLVVYDNFKVGECYTSDTFTLDGVPLCLTVYPQGGGKGKGKTLSVFLSPKGTDLWSQYSSVEVKWTLTLKSSVSNKKMRELAHTYTQSSEFGWDDDICTIQELTDTSKGYMQAGIFEVEVTFAAVLPARIVRKSRTIVDGNSVKTIVAYENFKDGECYTSDTFTLDGVPLCFLVYPRGAGKGKSTHLSVFLKALDIDWKDDIKSVNAKWTTTLHSTANKTKKMKELDHTFTNTSSWGWDNDIVTVGQLFDASNGYINDGYFEVESTFRAVVATYHKRVSRTIIEVDKAKVTTLVAIDNFKENECYTSDTFTLDGVPLNLLVYPYGAGKGKGTHLGVFLKPADSIDWKADVKSINAKWTTTLASSTGKTKNMKELDHTFNSSTTWGWDDDIVTVGDLKASGNGYVNKGIFDVHVVFNLLKAVRYPRVSKTIIHGRTVTTLVAIENYSSGESYTSDTFIYDDVPFNVIVYPYGSGKGKDTHLSVFVKPQSTIDWATHFKAVTARWTTVLRSSAGQTKTMSEIKKTFTSSSTWGWDDDIVTVKELNDASKGFINNGYFAVDCTFPAVVPEYHLRQSKTIVHGSRVTTLVAIDNFKDGEYYRSDTFIMDGVPLCLHVYPRGGGRGRGSHLSVFLTPEASIDWNTDVKSVLIKWVTCLKSSKGRTKTMSELSKKFSESICWGWDDDICTVAELTNTANGYVNRGIIEVETLFNTVDADRFRPVSKTIVNGNIVTTLVVPPDFPAGEYYKSGTFVLDGVPLCLHVYPNGGGKGTGTHLSVFLCPEQSIDWKTDIKSITATWTTVLKSSLAQKTKAMKELTHTFTKSASWGWDDDIISIADLMAVQNGYYSKGVITVDVLLSSVVTERFPRESRTIINGNKVRTEVVLASFGDGQCYESDTFVFDGVPFCLLVYPQGSGKGKGTHLSVFLKPVDSIDWATDLKSVTAKWSTLLKSFKSNKSKLMADLDHTFSSSQSWGWDDDICTIADLTNEENGFLEGGVFEVEVTLKSVAALRYPRESRTIINGSKITTVVVFDNFAPGKYYKSDTFKMDGVDLCLHVYPRGGGRGKGSHLSVFLCPEQSVDWKTDIEHVFAQWTTTLRSSVPGKTRAMRKLTRTFNDSTAFGYDDDIATVVQLSDESNGYLHNGVFEVDVVIEKVRTDRYPRGSKTIIDGNKIITLVDPRDYKDGEKYKSGVNILQGVPLSLHVHPRGAGAGLGKTLSVFLCPDEEVDWKTDVKSVEVKWTTTLVSTITGKTKHMAELCHTFTGSSGYGWDDDIVSIAQLAAPENGYMHHGIFRVEATITSVSADFFPRKSITIVEGTKVRTLVDPINYDAGQSYKSDTFILDNVPMCLHVYPKGSGKGKGTHLSVFVAPEADIDWTNDVKSIAAKWTTLLKSSVWGKEKKMKEINHSFTSSSSWGWDDDIVTVPALVEASNGYLSMGRFEVEVNFSSLKAQRHPSLSRTIVNGNKVRTIVDNRRFKAGEYYKSDTFTLEGVPLCLHVHPRGGGRGKGTHLSVFVTPDTAIDWKTEVRSITCRWTTLLKSSVAGKAKQMKELSYKFSNGYGYGWDDDIVTVEELNAADNGYVNGNTLEVEVAFLAVEPEFFPRQNKTIINGRRITTIVDALGFAAGDYYKSDMFKVDNVPFHLHVHPRGGGKGKGTHLSAFLTPAANVNFESEIKNVAVRWSTTLNSSVFGKAKVMKELSHDFTSTSGWGWDDDIVSIQELNKASNGYVTKGMLELEILIRSAKTTRHPKGMVKSYTVLDTKKIITRVNPAAFKNGEYYKSDTCVVDKVPLCLHVYPRGGGKGKGTHLSVFLCPEDTIDWKKEYGAITVRWVTVLKSSAYGKTKTMKELKHTFKSSTSWGWDNDIVSISALNNKIYGYIASEGLFEVEVRILEVTTEPPVAAAVAPVSAPKTVPKKKDFKLKGWGFIYCGDLVLDCEGEYTGIGTHIIVNHKKQENFNSQLWRAEYRDDDKHFHLINKNSNKCIDMEGQDVVAGRKLVLWVKKNFESQRWSYDGVRFRSETEPNIVMDVFDKDITAGDEVQSWNTTLQDKTSDQNFVFVPVGENVTPTVKTTQKSKTIARGQKIITLVAAENFAPGEFYKSDVFQVDGVPFHVHVHPSGGGKGQGTHLSVFLTPSDTIDWNQDIKSINARWTTTLVSSAGKTKHMGDLSYDFKAGTGFGWDNDICTVEELNNPSNGYLKNGVLEVEVVIKSATAQRHAAAESHTIINGRKIITKVDPQAFKAGECYKSDSCVLEGVPLNVHVYPRGGGKGKNTHLSVFLAPASSVDFAKQYKSVAVKWVTVLKSAMYSKNRTMSEISHTFTNHNAWGWDNDIVTIPVLNNASNKYINKDGVFEVEVRITMVKPERHVVKSSTKKTPPAAKPKRQFEGWGHIYCGDLVLDCESGSSAIGTHVIVAKPKTTNNDSQLWQMEYEGSGKAFQIVNKKAGKSIDMEGQDVVAGRKLVLWVKKGAPSQRWVHDGTRFRSDTANDIVMDVFDKDITPGDEVQSWNSASGKTSDQTFTFVPVGQQHTPQKKAPVKVTPQKEKEKDNRKTVQSSTIISGKRITARVAAGSFKAGECYKSDICKLDGVPFTVHVYPCGGGKGKGTHLSVFLAIDSSFKWGKEYSSVLVKWGTVLKSSAYGRNKTMKEITHKFTSGDAWGWDNDICTIDSLNNKANYYVNKDGLFEVDVRITLVKPERLAATPTKKSAPPAATSSSRFEGWGFIRCGKFVLECERGATGIGTQVIIANKKISNNDSQLWRMEYDAKSNFQIINKKANKCIDMEGQDVAAGRKLVLWVPKKGANSQHWQHDGTRFRNSTNKDLVMDVFDKDISAGDELQSWDASAGKASDQTFSFESVAGFNAPAPPPEKAQKKVAAKSSTVINGKNILAKVDPTAFPAGQCYKTDASVIQGVPLVMQVYPRGTGKGKGTHLSVYLSPASYINWRREFKSVLIKWVVVLKSSKYGKTRTMSEITRTFTSSTSYGWDDDICTVDALNNADNGYLNAAGFLEVETRITFINAERHAFRTFSEKKTEAPVKKKSDKLEGWGYLACGRFVLDCRGGSTSIGTNVVLNNKKPREDSQLWRMEYENNGKSFQIMNKKANKCIDMEGHDVVAGRKLILWVGKTDASQRWVYDGTRFQSKTNTNIVMDVFDTHLSVGDELQSWDATKGKTSDQTFTFVPV